ncbi:MAG: hypothetical protein ACQEWM_12400 [Actinomycetota bacterium]
MSRLRSAIAGATMVLVVAGCATTTGSGPDAPSASEVAPAPPSPMPTPTPSPGVGTGASAQARLAELPVPSASGPVLAVGTVLDAGTPMLCFMVLASLPPQCGGPVVVGWDWTTVPHEEASGVRWTETVALRATYDATAQTVTLTEPPLDLAAITMPAREVPEGDLDETTIAALQADLNTIIDRPDVLGNGGERGTMVLEVVYDDGSMQGALDEIYGEGVVHVEPWFID